MRKVIKILMLTGFMISGTTFLIGIPIMAYTGVNPIWAAGLIGFGLWLMVIGIAIDIIKYA